MIDFESTTLGPSGEINRGLPNAETLDLCRKGSLKIILPVYKKWRISRVKYPTVSFCHRTSIKGSYIGC